jgi:hypothetical protein
MYQIEVNHIRMPTLYYTLHDAMDACRFEEERGCVVFTEIVMVC